MSKLQRDKIFSSNFNWVKITYTLHCFYLGHTSPSFVKREWPPFLPPSRKPPPPQILQVIVIFSSSLSPTAPNGAWTCRRRLAPRLRSLVRRCLRSSESFSESTKRAKCSSTATTRPTCIEPETTAATCSSGSFCSTRSLTTDIGEA